LLFTEIKKQYFYLNLQGDINAYTSIWFNFIKGAYKRLAILGYCDFGRGNCDFSLKQAMGFQNLFRRY
jgi:hypothetical protein